MKTLEADLQAIKDFIADYHVQELAKKKEFLTKLEEGKFEEVAHELLPEDKLIKFLGSSAIELGVAKDKKIIEADLENIISGLQYRIIDKINNYKDKANVKEAEQKMGNAILKHAKTDGQEDVCDMKVFKFIAEEAGEALEHSEYMPYPLTVLDQQTGRYIIKDSYKITDISGDERTELECNINQESFRQWVSEHFLVKDSADGMAYLELVY